MKKVFHIPAILFAAALLFFNTGLYARHIIGGTMSYKVSPASPGFKNLQVKLLLVRDCSPANNGAYFDNLANIAIYKGTLQFNSLFRTYEVTLGNIVTGLATIQPGISAPESICEETGEYILSDSLPELAAGESYFIEYQRCCKSLFFLNVADPENTGLTLSIELSAAAMDGNNDSPVFEQPASVLWCTHDSLVFNRPVIETDGDTYIYRLSSLVSGGGADLSNPGVFSCEGAMPSPPCGPPFTLVNYAGTEYTPQTPLALSPVLLNPVTGVFTCLPQAAGAYLIGLDVDEYRNGVLFSTVHSEFAIYTTDCFVGVSDDMMSFEKEIVVAPNPSASSMLIMAIDAEWNDAVYTLKNMSGTTIQNGKLNGRRETITRDALPAGVYLLEIVAKDGRRRTEKVVFQ